MSAAGIPDCSRAARLIIKDVANGKVKWIAAPPNISQEEFDKYTYGKFLKDGEDKSSKKKGNALLQQVYYLFEVYLYWIFENFFTFIFILVGKTAPFMLNRCNC